MYILIAPSSEEEKTVYCGDVPPKSAYEVLSKDPQAVLIDVRTPEELLFVGGPQVENQLKIPWLLYPSMVINTQFVENVEQNIVSKDAPIFLICRSGHRSASAAQALTARGYKKCYNVIGGFEGDCNIQGRRGLINGWKHAGLDWTQN